MTATVNLKLVAEQAAGLNMHQRALVNACQMSLDGTRQPGLQFQNAVQELEEAVAHIDDVWVNPATDEVRHDEPLDSAGWLRYGRPAIVEALMGPALSAYLP